MTNDELERKLKAARTPSLGKDYLDDLPRQIFARLRSTPIRETKKTQRLPRLAWGGSFAFACLLLGFAIGRWHTEKMSVQTTAFLQNTKMIRETLAMFPNQVRAIVQDEHGLRLVLSDQANVPSSTPLYVQICNGKKCSSLVTFSGQEIQIGGKKLTVLSDAAEGIILMGNDFAWSSRDLFDLKNGLKIEAKRILLTAR